MDTHRTTSVLTKILIYQKAEIDKKDNDSAYVFIITFFLVFLLDGVIARGNEKKRNQNKAKSREGFYKIFFMMPCEIKNILSLDFKLYDCAILPHESNHTAKKEKTICFLVVLFSGVLIR